MMTDLWKDIQYVASLGSSGCPLATLLAMKGSKNLIFLHDRWTIIESLRPMRPFDVDIVNKKILIVDSIMRTGLTVSNGIRTIKERGGTPYVAVIVLLNEWVDKTLFADIADVNLYFVFPWNKRMFELAREKKLC